MTIYQYQDYEINVTSRIAYSPKAYNGWITEWDYKTKKVTDRIHIIKHGGYKSQKQAFNAAKKSIDERET